MKSKPKVRPHNYKNGKTEIASFDDNKEARLMRWIDFILKWLIRFWVLHILSVLVTQHQPSQLLIYLDKLIAMLSR